MDFLLEPLEIGFDDFSDIDSNLKISCAEGFKCITGTVEPLSDSDDDL